MKRLLAIFFTITLSCGQSFAVNDERLPDVNQAPIKSSAVEGEKNVETAATGEVTSRAVSIYPSNAGTAGIFRLRSAESLPEGTLTFGIGGEYYSVNDAPNFTPFGLNNGSHASTIAESIFVGIAPTKNLTLAVMRRSSSTTFGDPPHLISSLGDFNFTAMYQIILNESFSIAPIGNFLIASNFNSLSPSGNTLSGAFGLAATFSLFPTTSVPMYFHANLIYSMPQIRGSAPVTVAPETFFNFSRHDTVTLGLGAEYKLGDVIPFIELYDTINAGSGLTFSDNPSKITLGARFTPLDNKSVAILLGADIGLGRGLAVGVPYSPSYQVLGQLSYTVGLNQTERKHYATTSDVNIVDRKFIISKNVNFKTASAELEVGSTVLLDQIAQVIKDNQIKKLMIIGHTDSSHTEDYNLKLSTDRANTVKRYLVSKEIADETLITQGYGKRKPRASNATEEGRTLNRRVEFFILE